MFHPLRRVDAEETERLPEDDLHAEREREARLRELRMFRIDHATIGIEGMKLVRDADRVLRQMVYRVRFRDSLDKFRKGREFPQEFPFLRMCEKLEVNAVFRIVILSPSKDLCILITEIPCLAGRQARLEDSLPDTLTRVRRAGLGMTS